MGYPNLMPSYGGLVEPRGSNLTQLKSTFNAEHTQVVIGLSWTISAQFTVKIVYCSLKSRKIHKKNLFWGCRSRSSMLVPPASSSAVLVMMSSKSVSICNRSHARRANSGKITISKGGTPLWCPRSRGISSPSGTKLPRKKLETLLSYGEDPESLSYLALNPYRVVTDGRTDRQNRSYGLSAVPAGTAVARKKPHSRE